MLPAVKPTPHWIAEKLRVFQDPDFTFEPVAHRYTLGGQELTSATTWLKQFCAPFEREKIAAERSAATGYPAQHFLDEWDRAAWVGTKTHEFIEHFWQNTATPEMALCDPEVSVRVDKFLGMYRQHLHRLTPIAQELRIFHQGSGLCGTIDSLVENEHGQLFVLDYKTSKKIDTDQDKIWRFLKAPFASLGDNEHNKYSLQISLYRVILQEAGIYTQDGYIVWLPTAEKEPQLIPALDFRQQVNELLSF